MRPEFVDALERAGQGEQLTKNDLITLLNADKDESRTLLKPLTRRANTLREVHF